MKGQWDCVLNGLEELGGKEFVLMGQYNIEIFSCFLRLLPLYSSTNRQTNAVSSQIRAEDNLLISRIQSLHIVLEVDDHDEEECLVSFAPFSYERFHILHTFLRVLRKTVLIYRNSCAKVLIVSKSAQQCIDNFPPPLLLSWPLDNGLVARKTGCPLSANVNIIFSAILSRSPCGLSSLIEDHFLLMHLFFKLWTRWYSFFSGVFPYLWSWSLPFLITHSGIERRSTVYSMKPRWTTISFNRCPHVQWTMPSLQYERHSLHCVSGSVSNNSNSSTFPTSWIICFDFALNGL